MSICRALDVAERKPFAGKARRAGLRSTERFRDHGNKRLIPIYHRHDWNEKGRMPPLRGGPQT